MLLLFGFALDEAYYILLYFIKEYNLKLYNLKIYTWLQSFFEWCDQGGKAFKESSKEKSRAYE